jgi:anti-sigma factor RsiW
MKCEEFEARGLDAERDASLSEIERVAAREHASTCSRCASLQDSWQSARAELRAFAEATAAAETPSRVEMRLRQEFRTQHGTLKTRRVAVITAWALAAAAVLVAGVSWQSWRNSQTGNLTGHAAGPQSVNPGAGNSAGAGNNSQISGYQTSGAQTAVNEQNSGESGSAETLMAQADAGDFTLLPGALPADTDDAAILRVRMQRGSLGALGLPVNEERASEWIQVDLLVGNDGLPQAVRLPQ